MYTMQRCLVVMIGAALASIAGAQSMPYQPPPDASSYQGPAPDAPAAYGNTAPAQNDPPGRVARLSYLNGEVSFTPAGEENWVQAQLNRPVVTGDKLWTNGDARAEVSIGAATVRLDRNSSFDFLNLDDQLAQMELTQGALNLEVRRLHGNETYEVDTPTLAFIANRVGDYRIHVEPNGGTVVTAWRGGGDAIGEGGRRVAVEEGQSVRFGDSQLNNPQVTQIGPSNQTGPSNENPQVAQGGARDDFDNFVTEREQRYTNAPHQYVSEDVVGYEDLDQYGSWEDAPQYGHVWYPHDVAADWAPYHDGHWAWIDPWGWTWVDNAPWGYAPSHYGRWAYVDSRWGWVPGPIDVAPVYAPAFVAFVGGGGVSVGFSVGGPVGWFALGPSDVYFPGYHCGPDYFARVNYSNAYVNHTVVNNYYGGWSNGSLNYSQMHYANRDAPRAMTAMRGDAFVAGRPVAGAAIAVNRETFANARVMPRANLMPTRESLVAGGSRASAPPATAINRPVIAANRPAPTAPSFEQRQALLQRNGGQPLTRNQMRTVAAQQQPGSARVAAANNVRVVGNNNRGSAVPARTAAESGANRGGNTAGATAEANVRAPASNARAAGQTPSRAAEMNRSPEHANAQYQRSAGFAHQGVIPGSERATNAQQGRTASAPRETAQSGENAQTRATRNMPQQSEQANRGNAPQNAQHLNSSTFAHGGQNARVAAGTQQREEAAANARGNAQQRERTAAASATREQAQARDNAMAQQNAHARAEANTRAEANARAESDARASANARAAESARQSREAQSRAAEQRTAAAEQSRAASQARAQQQRAQQQQRTPPENRPSYTQQQRAPAPPQQQREATVQQQRAQPQVAHSPPPQRGETPMTRSQPTQQAQRSEPRPQPQQQPQVARAPQQPEQQQRAQPPQKAQPPQRQVARSAAPQPRQPAPKKDEKDKNNGGG